MGDFTYTELQTMVKDGRGGRTENLTLVVQAIGIAEKFIAQKFGFEDLIQDPFDITLTESTASFALSGMITVLNASPHSKAYPTGTKVKDILGLSVIDGTSQYPLKGVVAEKWEKCVPGHADADTESRPTIYTRYNKDTILLYPTPGDDYTVRCLVSLWPVPIQHTAGVLTAGSDPGEASAYSMLDDKDAAIIAYALMWLYSLTGNQEKAGHFFGVFNDQMGAVDKNRQPDVSTGKGGVSGSSQVSSQESAPSTAALAGSTGWDGSYNSTPWW